MKAFCKKANVASLDEKTLIARICSRLGTAVPKYPMGSGDDCAVLKKNSFSDNVYATSDAVILGVHFAESTPPRLAGEKLLKRNVSDIASMGGVPTYALTSSIFSKNLSLKWLDEFCLGLGESAQKYGVKIVGGDVASAGDFFFSTHLALLGDSKYPPLLRKGAGARDFLYVTGALGYSFESGRHLTFEPRVREGQFLAKWNAKTSSIISCTDLSDGFSSDVANILPADCCTIIDVKNLPCASFGKKIASIERALSDGEDYELLFAFRGTDKERLAFEKSYAREIGVLPICIGRVAKKTRSHKSALLLNFGEGNLREFRGKGFDHFVS